MIRWVAGLLLASSLSPAAVAGDAWPVGQTGRAPVDTHCAGLGEGFFAVAGSSACIRISGRISAGAGFGTAKESTGSFGAPVGGAPASGFNTETAASGDLRFDTPAGPARLYVGVRRDTDPRWAADSQ